MQDKLDRDQLVRLVAKIMRAEGTEEELDAWIALVDKHVPGPTGSVSGLIFWPSRHGLGDEPTAEQIVDMALSYKSIEL
jgi:hypothetical protein